MEVFSPEWELFRSCRRLVHAFFFTGVAREQATLVALTANRLFFAG